MTRITIALLSILSLAVLTGCDFGSGWGEPPDGYCWTVNCGRNGTDIRDDSEGGGASARPEAMRGQSAGVGRVGAGRGGGRRQTQRKSEWIKLSADAQFAEEASEYVADGILFVKAHSSMLDMHGVVVAEFMLQDSIGGNSVVTELTNNGDETYTGFIYLGDLPSNSEHWDVSVRMADEDSTFEKGARIGVSL